jgi:hypothetical protein
MFSRASITLYTKLWNYDERQNDNDDTENYDYNEGIILFNFRQ